MSEGQILMEFKFIKLESRWEYKNSHLDFVEIISAFQKFCYYLMLLKKKIKNVSISIFLNKIDNWEEFEARISISILQMRMPNYIGPSSKKLIRNPARISSIWKLMKKHLYISVSMTPNKKTLNYKVYQLFWRKLREDLKTKFKRVKM